MFNLFLANLSFWVTFIPVILYLLFHLKSGDKALRVIFILLIGGILLEFIGKYTSKIYHNNTFTLNIFTIFETLLIVYFFFTIYAGNYAKKIALVLGGLFLSFWLFQQVKNGLNVFDETSLALEQILIILLSIYYLFEQLRNPESLFVYTNPRFWVVIAYFLYMSATFFLFLFLMSFSNEEKSKYLILNSLFIIIKIIFLSVAMFMRTKQPKTKKFHLS